MSKQQPQPQTFEITKQATTDLLIRLFKALQKAFETPADNGVVRAYELIEKLTETAENDPDVFRSVLTEENLAAFSDLQKKAQTGNVGLTDFVKAFPGIGNAMKGGMFGKLFK
ncbi:hypothetical protein GCM10028807_49990 [Spirosoma daeguense]